MTSWVITIDKDHPQHWNIAKFHSFWDTTKFFPVELGDAIYFWQAGGSMIAQCRAITSAFPITPGHSTPWEDSGKRQYRARFGFSVISENPNSAPSWSKLQSEMVTPATLQTPRAFENPKDDLVLAALFGSPIVDASFGDDARERELARLGFDLRVFDFRAISRRQGQPKFRNKLIEAYQSSCAITGSNTVEVLEAAHISPFKGAHTHRLDNGLLLRSDVHTLFDLQRLTVLPNLTVSVHPELRSGAYGDWHGRPLASVPTAVKDRPAKALLERHNSLCHWQ